MLLGCLLALLLLMLQCLFDPTVHVFKGQLAHGEHVGGEMVSGPSRLPVYRKRVGAYRDKPYRVFPRPEVKQPDFPLPPLAVDVVLVLVLPVDVEEVERLVDPLGRELVDQSDAVSTGNLRLAGSMDLLAVDVDLPDPVVLAKVLEKGHRVAAFLLDLEGDLDPRAEGAVLRPEPRFRVGGAVVRIHLELDPG